jgi:hypothetical protein
MQQTTCTGCNGSLNHFVGADEECRRDFEAKHFGRLEIDNKLELGRLHGWQRRAWDACDLCRDGEADPVTQAQ